MNGCPEGWVESRFDSMGCEPREQVEGPVNDQPAAEDFNMSDNAGMRGAAALASERLASVANVKIPDGTKVQMRTFDTGATRDSDDGKIHYKGFLSRKALKLFGAYMEKHRVQRDGSLRDPDNWKKGIPREAYEDSGDRHWQEFMGMIEDGNRGPEAAEALLAHLFNVQGWLHEYAKYREAQEGYRKPGTPSTNV